MKTIYLIRHGMTEGNRQRRYIGRTDEPLCQEGREQAKACTGLPDFDRVFVSPYLRCRQTAELLFPQAEQVIVENLRECDFGSFENRTADEMADDPEYTAWVESQCLGDIPGGEPITDFKERCCAEFTRTVEELNEGSTAAFVIHGGCIMAILERFALPKRSFYEYHLGNCAYRRCTLENQIIRLEKDELC